MERWNREALLEFWGDWYFPANATLHIVGQLDRSVRDTVELIERTFGSVPPGRERQQGPGDMGAGGEVAQANHAIGGGRVVAGGAGLAPALVDAGAGNGNGAAALAHADAEVLPPLKRRHQVRRSFCHGSVHCELLRGVRAGTAHGQQRTGGDARGGDAGAGAAEGAL